MPWRAQRKHQGNHEEPAIAEISPTPVIRLLPEVRWSPNFPPFQAQHQPDAVARQIVRTIHELGIRDMCFLAANVRVKSLTNCPPIWPISPHNADIEVKMYIFENNWSSPGYPVSTIAPVQVLDRSAKHLSESYIVVRSEGVWKPLPQFLLSQPFIDRDAIGRDEHHDVQRNWWDHNGKHFRLLDLPKELRRKVLKTVLGGKIWPTASQSGVGLEKQFVLFDKWDANRAILGVSREVREEAHWAGWAGNRKYFNGRQWMFRQMMDSPNPPCPNWLTKIGLAMENGEFLDFFGLELDPTGDLTTVHLKPVGPLHCGAALQRIKTLKDLRLRFKSPYSQDNPWKSLRNRLRRQGTVAPDVLHRMSTITCSRTMTEWILSCAHPYIKHISTVKLVGGIKDAVKKRFERIFAEEYLRKYEPARRTLGFNYDQAIEQIAQTPFSSAPVCHCPLPCDKEKMWEVNGYRYLRGEFDRNDEFSPALLKRLAHLYELMPFDARETWHDRIHIFGPGSNIAELEAEYPQQVVQDEDEDEDWGPSYHWYSDYPCACPRICNPETASFADD